MLRGDSHGSSSELPLWTNELDCFAFCSFCLPSQLRLSFCHFVPSVPRHSFLLSEKRSLWWLRYPGYCFVLRIFIAKAGFPLSVLHIPNSSFPHKHEPHSTATQILLYVMKVNGQEIVKDRNNWFIPKALVVGSWGFVCQDLDAENSFMSLWGLHWWYPLLYS